VRGRPAAVGSSARRGRSGAQDASIATRRRYVGGASGARADRGAHSGRASRGGERGPRDRDVSCVGTDRIGDSPCREVLARAPSKYAYGARSRDRRAHARWHSPEGRRGGKSSRPMRMLVLSAYALLLFGCGREQVEVAEAFDRGDANADSSAGNVPPFSSDGA